MKKKSIFCPRGNHSDQSWTCLSRAEHGLLSRAHIPTCLITSRLLYSLLCILLFFLLTIHVRGHFICRYFACRSMSFFYLFIYFLRHSFKELHRNPLNWQYHSSSNQALLMDIRLFSAFIFRTELT